MESKPGVISDQILVFDAGATSIKYCRVSRSGERLDNVRRRPTPRPLSPENLIAFVQKRLEQFDVMNVALGFPGECVDGMTIECGNLAKSSGGDGSVDEPIAAMWRGFHLQWELQKTTGKNVRVVNDALLAALGCVRGVGRELMVTLGTGCGVALMIDGVPMKISDFGARPFLGDLTFDEALGESGRTRNEEIWHVNVVRGLTRLSNEFEADRVFVGGGNALRLSPNLELERQESVTIVRNESALLGAAKLFSKA